MADSVNESEYHVNGHVEAFSGAVKGDVFHT